MRTIKDVNFEVIDDLPDMLLIKDLGPWDQFSTVTNAVEQVVTELAGRLGKRRLCYIDSEGNTDEILVKDGQFAGFFSHETMSK